MIADAVPTRRGGGRHPRRGSIGQRSPNGNATAVPAVLRASPIAGWGTNDQATTSRSGRYRVDVGCRLRADLSAGATASARHTGNLRASATADPGSSTTTTTVAPLTVTTANSRSIRKWTRRATRSSRRIPMAKGLQAARRHTRRQRPTATAGLRQLARRPQSQDRGGSGPGMERGRRAHHGRSTSAPAQVALPIVRYARGRRLEISAPAHLRPSSPGRPSLHLRAKGRDHRQKRGRRSTDAVT